MQSVRATDFVNNFGRCNQEVQREIIEVTSHGRPIGYYVSPAEFAALSKLHEDKAKYSSIKPKVLEVREKIRDIAVKHNANGIYLFGSVARGDDNSQSDIDFIVDFPKIYDLFRDRLALANALEDLFGRKIDLIVKDELNKEIAMSAYKDAILL